MALSLRKRFGILKRDHFTCLYCGARPPGVELVVDHVRSRANGGGDAPSNLITACATCNQGKSAKSVECCASCVRPMCRGPRSPRDALEAKCVCDCHACPQCFAVGCAGTESGICSGSILSDAEMFHDVSVEEAFE